MVAAKPTVGALVRIDLHDGNNGFGRVLGHSEIAFYDKRIASTDQVDVDDVVRSPVLFVVSVMDSAIGSRRWPVIGVRALEAALREPREYFLKDKLSGKFSKYRGDTGSMREATFEECRRLECAAVWDPEHVEDRLRDHFAGRSNKWVEQLRAVQ